MKHLEKFNTINSSDMENWNPKQDTGSKDKYTGSKNLDLKLGAEVKNLLEEYNLDVQVGPGDWLKQQQCVLKSEEKFKEYRVHFSIIMTWKDFLDNEGVDEDEYESLPEKEKEQLREDYESTKIDDDTRMEFSVFLPFGTKFLVEAALADASIYLNMLSNCIPEIFRFTMNDCLKDETDGFKCFLNTKEIVITNNNIEDVPTINYRIYKDSKFFVELKDVLKNDARNLINDWLKLIK